VCINELGEVPSIYPAKEGQKFSETPKSDITMYEGVGVVTGPPAVHAEKLIKNDPKLLLFVKHGSSWVHGAEIGVDATDRPAQSESHQHGLQKVEPGLSWETDNKANMNGNADFVSSLDHVLGNAYVDFFSHEVKHLLRAAL